MQTLGEVQFSDAQRELILAFCMDTGYGERDILAVNFATRMFMTKNGGKYHLQEDNHVKWIFGPPVEVEYRL